MRKEISLRYVHSQKVFLLQHDYTRKNTEYAIFKTNRGLSIPGAL
jgi:hypothetical protein